MHFTSYSTKTQIAQLDTFISLPKSLKNRLKSVPEATSCFCCLSGAILTTILGAKILRKFVENHSQTCLHTQNRAKMAENDAKMLPEASTRLQNSSPSAPKRIKFGLSRQPFSIPIQDSQLTIRSLQLARSTIISMELSRQLFRPECKIHIS